MMKCWLIWHITIQHNMMYVLLDEFGWPFIQLIHNKCCQKRYAIFLFYDIDIKSWLIYNYSVLSLDRMACGYAYYAISFGVEQLSGSIYLNMFLLSIVEIPATLLTWWLNNWYIYIFSFVNHTIKSKYHLNFTFCFGLQTDKYIITCIVFGVNYEFQR